MIAVRRVRRVMLAGARALATMTLTGVPPAGAAPELSWEPCGAAGAQCALHGAFRGSFSLPPCPSTLHVTAIASFFPSETAGALDLALLGL